MTALGVVCCKMPVVEIDEIDDVVQLQLRQSTREVRPRVSLFEIWWYVLQIRCWTKTPLPAVERMKKQLLSHDHQLQPACCSLQTSSVAL